MGVKAESFPLLVLNLFALLIFSEKPQEFNDRLEKQHEAKKEVLGHSKQADFVRLMEEEVRREANTAKSREIVRVFSSSALGINLLLLVCSWRIETRCPPAAADSRRTR